MPRLALAWSHVDGDECLRIEGLRDPVGVDVYPVDHGDARTDEELRARFPAMSGRYVVDGTSVCFVPRFPFRDGTTYRVVSRGDVEPDHHAPAHATQRHVPHVVGVQPTARTLPRNHLRFYVTFSEPMCDGEAAEHVHLRRADTGEELDDVFLAFDPELWDASRTRLTVLLDPARIKRGLVPHDEVGYPLVEGVAVELVIDDGFRDARGAPLTAPFVQRYGVGPDLRGLVEPSRWIVDVPPAGSRDPLVVHFDRPLDAALVARCLRASVPGTAALGAEEMSWEFRPATAWQPTSTRSWSTPCSRTSPGTPSPASSIATWPITPRNHAPSTASAFRSSPRRAWDTNNDDGTLEPLPSSIATLERGDHLDGAAAPGRMGRCGDEAGSRPAGDPHRRPVRSGGCPVRSGGCPVRRRLLGSRFDSKFEVLEHKFTATLHQELRSLTWKILAVVIAAMSAMLGALVGVARF